MQILLINPPQTIFRGSRSPRGGLPLGIMYVGAMLDKAGYKVEILDALMANFPPQRQGEMIHYGMPWERIKEEIKLRKPDIVGVSGVSTAQIENAVKIAQLVKQIDHSIPTVVGGPHVSVRAMEFLANTPSVDVAVLGEGEYTMVDIVECYSQGKVIGEIPGIAYREDGQVKLSPPRPFIRNLDEIPFPAYHLVDMEVYFKPKWVVSHGQRFVREIPMITSRGCPFNCIFCAIHLHMGRKWRAHSVDYVLAHIEYVIKEYGVQHIHFEDDNLILNTKRFEDILDGILEKGLKFTWDTPNGVRADRLTPSLLQKAKKTGLTHLAIGIESGDQEVLNNIIDKRLNLKKVVEVAKMCQQLDIKLGACYMIGLPGEKEENIQRTLDFALALKRKYGVNMFLSIATPYYGTRLYEIAQSKGYLTEEPTPRFFAEAEPVWGKGIIKTEDFSPEDLLKWGTKAMSVYNRIALWDYIRHPWLPLRWALKNPRDVRIFLEKLVGR